jgi:hypothetical protein
MVVLFGRLLIDVLFLLGSPVELLVVVECRLCSMLDVGLFLFLPELSENEVEG